MKVLVCIKQVPDMESKFKINGDNSWYDEADLAYRMNEYDEFAVEQAVQLKAQEADTDLTVFTIGPERAKEAMKKALAMGCDRGVHVVDADSYKKDAFQIASMIFEFAKDKEFDVIFTGMQSQDRGSAQVGVLLGEMLNIPSISTIVEFAYEAGTITARRELEGGVKAAVKTSTPALVTCQLGLNTPRYPTLPNIMKAKKKELLNMTPDELLNTEILADTDSFYTPEKKDGGLVLEGDVADMADQLVKILKEKTSVFA